MPAAFSNQPGRHCYSCDHATVKERQIFYSQLVFSSQIKFNLAILFKNVEIQDWLN